MSPSERVAGPGHPGADPDTDTGPAVRYTVHDPGVAVLTLNRPERLNTWGGDLAAALFDGLDRAHADPAVRAIVLTGSGRAFCAGANLGGANGLRPGSGGLDGDPDLSSLVGDRHPWQLTTVRKPIVAAVNGACVGIGLTLALMCDVRFAAEEARFAAPFARRGLIAEYGVSWILPRLIGWAAAADLLLSGRTVGAVEARELGLVTETVPGGRVLDRALEYAGDIALHCSPASLAVIKRQLYADTVGDLASASAASEQLLRESLRRPDVVEGVVSFLEKRPPRFPPPPAAARQPADRRDSP